MNFFPTICITKSMFYNRSYILLARSICIIEIIPHIGSSVAKIIITCCQRKKNEYINLTESFSFFIEGIITES